jgi:hypothetical protein
MVIAGVAPEPSNAGRISDWAREYSDALRPYTKGAALVNFVMRG